MFYEAGDVKYILQFHFAIFFNITSNIDFG